MQNILFPKVSVIVPVYNAGTFFQKCLDSIVNQTLEEIEIILVLDQPTDGSDLIARQYAEKYSNIILISNETNLHIGYSRNKGLQKARGKYIFFIDHDDYIDLDAFEKMFYLAENNNLDVLLTEIDSVDYSKPDCSYYRCSSNVLKHSSNLAEDCFWEQLTNRRENPTFFLYAHIFRRDFLKSYNAKFVDTREVTSEDILFNMEVYCHLVQQKGNIQYFPKVFYHRTLHPNNTGKTIQYREIKKFIPYLEKLYNLIEQMESILSSKVYDAYYKKLIRTLYTRWLYELKYRRLKAIKNLFLLQKSSTLKKFIKEQPLNYNKHLPVTKNLFILFIRLFVV